LLIFPLLCSAFARPGRITPGRFLAVLFDFRLIFDDFWLILFNFYAFLRLLFFGKACSLRFWQPFSQYSVFVFFAVFRYFLVVFKPFSLFFCRFSPFFQKRSCPPRRGCLLKSWRFYVLFIVFACFSQLFAKYR
jgi:hypothetical protein